jgi:hypothetical protein
LWLKGEAEKGNDGRGFWEGARWQTRLKAGERVIEGELVRAAAGSLPHTVAFPSASGMALGADEPPAVHAPKSD